MTQTLRHLCLLLLALPSPGLAQDGPQLSPFEMVRFKGDDPEVRLGGRWYQLLKIQGLPKKKLLDRCRREFGGRWAERFCEDLPQCLQLCNALPRDHRVSLELRDLVTGKVVQCTRVAMTRAKRAAIKAAEPRPAGVRRRVPRRRMPRGGDRVSPFEMVRFKGQDPQVKVAGRWYELLAIQGVAKSRLLQAIRAQEPEKWAKRFCEDLPQYLSLVQARPAGDTVSLRLRDLQTGKELVLPEAKMTAANRAAIWEAGPRPDPTDVDRAELPAAPALAGKLEAWRVPRALPAQGLHLNRAELRADLEQLHWLLRRLHSYADLRGFDYGQALALLGRRGAKGVDQRNLHLGLRSLVAQLGDGHARVRGLYGKLPPGFLPLGTRLHRGGVLALDSATSRLLDPAHPFLRSIDGRKLADWLSAAGRIEARGSAMLERRRAVDNLLFLNWLRHELDLPVKPEVSVELGDGKGGVRQLALRVASRPAPRQRERRDFSVHGRIARLRLPRMESGEGFVAFLHASMRQAKGCRGLIIDLRGNGGGSRVALRTLFPYFMADGSAPFVANIALYRMRTQKFAPSREGYLANRFLYPLTSRRWSEADQRAIRMALRSFKPRWMPPANQVSAPHFMLLRASRDAGQYHFAGPVAVLIDGGCFSATDIFAGASKDYPTLRLFGQPTSGGSGRSQSYTLVHSQLEVRLSSMVSYRPSGQLYDGVGVQPDQLVWPDLEDLRKGRDTVRAAAEQWIRSGG